MDGRAARPRLDPADVKRLFGGDPGVLHGGASSAVLEPLVGRHSVLLLDGEAHMTERRALLPAFHGDALARVRASMAQLAREEVAGWPARRPIRTLERMQSLTLRIILRALLGLAAGPDRDALEAATAGRSPTRTRSGACSRCRSPRPVRGSRCGRPSGATSPRSTPRSPARWSAGRRGTEPAIIDGLEAMHPSAERLRDQLVTLLAAGHVTTAAALSWACERLARHPAVQARLRVETALGDDAYLDAVVKEALRIRPVLVLAPRKLAAPFAIAGTSCPRASTSRRAPTSCTAGRTSTAPTRSPSGPSASSARPRPTTAGSPSAAACGAAWGPRSRRSR